ncbi:hypothetical protein N7520_009104, partial [Penicillium odoratum]|uniref:uncharacterized protein n=1 Tax=Penicillium odoratum TaxID=1167516 RepID=UPI002548152C
KRKSACSTILTKSGDTCATLAARCGITTAQLSEYNTDASLCSSITTGIPVCCSFGTLNLPPVEESDGLCYTYTVQANDTCKLIADGYQITVDQLKTYNDDTYGWGECGELDEGAFICLSSGSPPMPASLPNAICGPQVPGTARPSNMSDLDDLNPCLATNCKCNLDVGLCYNTVASSSGCPMSTAQIATTTTMAKTTYTFTEPTSTSTKTASTSIKSTSSSKKATSTATEPTSTSTKTPTTMSTSTSTKTTHKQTTTASTTSIVQITHVDWTPSTTTISTSSTATYNPWEIAMYAKADCEGDYYYLSGNNQDYSSTCLNVHTGTGISSSFTKTGTWCRWYTDGGVTSSDCDTSTLETPASWYLTSAICTVFPDSECTGKNGSARACTSWKATDSDGGCVNYAENKFDVSTWGSMQCNWYPNEA